MASYGEILVLSDGLRGNRNVVDALPDLDADASVATCRARRSSSEPLVEQQISIHSCGWLLSVIAEVKRRIPNPTPLIRKSPGQETVTHWEREAHCQ